MTKPARLIVGGTEEMAAMPPCQMVTRAMKGTFLATPRVIADLVNR